MGTVLDGRLALCSLEEEPTSFFTRRETPWWLRRDVWGCLSCTPWSEISHSYSHCCAEWNTLEWNCIGLITFEGSLGANLACLSRDKPFWFKILFLPDYVVLTSYPWVFCLSVHAVLGVCECTLEVGGPVTQDCVCVCTCTYTWSGSDTDCVCVCVCVCVPTLEVGGPVKQTNQIITIMQLSSQLG